MGGCMDVSKVVCGICYCCLLQFVECVSVVS